MASDQLLGEIRLFGGVFKPAGWQYCDGTIYPISTYPDLYNVIGTAYGGDGNTTFAVPDLQGRVPVHKSGTLLVGQAGGVEDVTLTTAQTPTHTHALTADKNLASISAPQGTFLAESSQINMYIADSPSVSLSPTSITSKGGSQPHTNMQPFLGMNFIIATEAGIDTNGAYVGEVRAFPYTSNTPPTGWAWCDGQLFAVSNNTALFSILSTLYGGDGKSTFALPDLQGSIPIGFGQGAGLSLRDIGEMNGQYTVTLLESEMPAHTHAFRVSPDPGEIATPGANQILARSQGGFSYHTSANLVAMAPEALAPAGGDQPHNNLMPYRAMRYAIALQGTFPNQ